MQQLFVIDLNQLYSIHWSSPRIGIFQFKNLTRICDIQCHCHICGNSMTLVLYIYIPCMVFTDSSEDILWVVSIRCRCLVRIYSFKFTKEICDLLSLWAVNCYVDSLHSGQVMHVGSHHLFIQLYHILSAIWSISNSIIMHKKVPVIKTIELDGS